MICKEPGCDREAIAREYCRCHYQKHYRQNLSPARLANLRQQLSFSHQKYLATTKGANALARQRRRAKTLYRLNNLSPEKLQSQFPFLSIKSIELIVANRPITWKTVQGLLLEAEYNAVRSTPDKQLI